jgi:hypothetical protein
MSSQVSSASNRWCSKLGFIEATGCIIPDLLTIEFLKDLIEVVPHVRRQLPLLLGLAAEGASYRGCVARTGTGAQRWSGARSHHPGIPLSRILSVIVDVDGISEPLIEQRVGTGQVVIADAIPLQYLIVVDGGWIQAWQRGTGVGSRSRRKWRRWPHHPHVGRVRLRETFGVGQPRPFPPTHDLPSPSEIKSAISRVDLVVQRRRVSATISGGGGREGGDVIE